MDTEEVARQLLERDHFIPYRLAQVRALPSLVRLLPFLFKPKPQELIDFSRGLASLLRSGIPIRDALLALRDQSKSLGLKDALRQILVDVESGDRFSDACSRYPALFPGFYVRLLRVGEATGGIPIALQQLTTSMAKRKETQDKVKGALLYPAISLVVAVIAGFILVTYSIPALTKLLKEFGGQLPVATRLLITMSSFLETNQLTIMSTLIGVPLAVAGILRTRRGARALDALLLKMPVIGEVLVRTSMLGVASTLGTLLRAGIPPIESLRLTEEGIGNRVIRDALSRVTDDVSSGTRPGVAFRRESAFPPIFSQGILTGEMAGSLPATLDALAEYYEAETARSIAGATELIQPTVILLVAGAVGFVAVAVVSGIYSTIGSIK